MEAAKNILVCEDDPVQLRILTAMIQQAGYRPLAARSPSEGVAAARRCGIDAVLSDVQLQDGNAFELMGDLRRLGFDAPVFMTSAFATNDIEERARAAGANSFFEKPFNYATIKARVDEVLRAPRALKSTVLLLESHPQARADLEQSVAQAGFRVIAVEEGSRVLDILRTEGARIDLLLMDLHAKGPSGGELVQKALAIVPALHVIAVSGDAKREDIRAAYDAGAAAFLRKPISQERLGSFLKASLVSARDQRKQAETRREHSKKLAGESPFRKTRRWIKSCVHAPAGSRRGRGLRVLGCVLAAILIGMGVAAAFQRATEEESKIERLLRLYAGRPAGGEVRHEAARASSQADEQLLLMRESNDFTRQYYQEYLREMRQQAVQAARPPVASPVFPALSIPEGIVGKKSR